MEQEEKKVVSDDNLFLSSVKKSTDDRIEVIISSLTFVGPCIVIYFYSRTNQMHNNSNLFYFGTTLYMFRTVSPSVIRSLRLYIQHHTIQVYSYSCMLAGTRCSISFPLASSHRTCIHIPDLCTVLDSWWWTEKPSETCRVLIQNKINLRYCASGWCYCRNLSFEV